MASDTTVRVFTGGEYVDGEIEHDPQTGRDGDVIQVRVAAPPNGSRLVSVTRKEITPTTN